MVKTSTTQTAEMALYLNTFHPWCVSGTPIQVRTKKKKKREKREKRKCLIFFFFLFVWVQKTIKDLFGLLKFLRCEEALKQSPEALIQFLKQIMWRHAKKHVMDEIEIPDTKEINHTLNFSTLESFGYKKIGAFMVSFSIHHILSLICSHTNAYSREQKRAWTAAV
jgi:hypothetical protein